MANNLFLGGIFNISDPLLSLPLHIYLNFILFPMIIGFTWAGFYFLKWKPYTPLHGLYYAMRNGSTVAWIFDAFLVGDLVAERDAKCIFNYAEDEYEIDIPECPRGIPERLWIWFHTYFYYYPTHYLPDISPTDAIIWRIAGVNKDVEIAMTLEGGTWERSATVVCAGVPVDIVVDMDKWTIKQSAQHKAIVREARAWNEIHPTDQIHSYKKFQQKLLTGEMACPRELKKEFLIPWQRIDAAFPTELDENEWAGKKWQKSKDDEESDTLEIRKFTIYIFVGGLLLDFIMLMFKGLMALMGK
jgi:hypothetical protein